MNLTKEHPGGQADAEFVKHVQGDVDLQGYLAQGLHMTRENGGSGSSPSVAQGSMHPFQSTELREFIDMSPTKQPCLQS